jgi:flagellar basal-body rod modification protein FlgD
MSIAATVAQQNSAAAAAGTTTSTSSSGSAALTSLSSNFGDFLQLLMTQLKNQDPSSPLDSNQFTSELVQFSSVEQQINTNSALTQLIQLTQAQEVEQSSAILGKQVTVQSSQLSLQNGSGSIRFDTTNPEPVAIAVTNSAGVQVASAALTSTAGSNTWSWNGQNGNGVQMPDGAYTVSVTTSAGGASAAVPFNVVGTATSVTTQNNSVQLHLGALSVPFSSVQSVGG